MTTNISPIQDRQFVHGAIPLENESQELAGVLQKIVQNAGALLEVDSCSLALSDTKGTALITLAALQKNGQKPRHTRFELNEGEDSSQLPFPAFISRSTRSRRAGRGPLDSSSFTELWRMRIGKRPVLLHKVVEPNSKPVRTG